MIKRKLVAPLLVLLCCACADISKNPLNIDCRGKGNISGIGAGPLPNSWSVTADCGDGFSYHSGTPAPPPSTPTKPVGP